MKVLIFLILLCSAFNVSGQLRGDFKIIAKDIIPGKHKLEHEPEHILQNILKRHSILLLDNSTQVNNGQLDHILSISFTSDSIKLTHLYSINYTAGSQFLNHSFAYKRKKDIIQINIFNGLNYEWRIIKVNKKGVKFILLRVDRE